MRKIKVYVTRMKWDDGDSDSVYVVPTIIDPSSPWEKYSGVDAKLYEEMQKNEKLRGLPFPSYGYFSIKPVFEKEKFRPPKIGEDLTIGKIRSVLCSFSLQRSPTRTLVSEDGELRDGKTE